MWYNRMGSASSTIIRRRSASRIGNLNLAAAHITRCAVDLKGIGVKGSACAAGALMADIVGRTPAGANNLKNRAVVESVRAMAEGQPCEANL